MGKVRKDALRTDFGRGLKLEFHRTKVSSDAGLLACLELDEALGFDAELRGNRTGENTQHGITALLRQSIYSRLVWFSAILTKMTAESTAGGVESQLRVVVL